MKKEILAKCCELFDVHERDLMGKYKFHFVVRARFALYKALHMRGWSQSEIGRFLKRDRSSVRNGIDKCEYLLKRDPDFAGAVKILATMQSMDIAKETPPND